MKTVAGMRTQLLGGITSISILEGKPMVVGTSQCNRYEVKTDLSSAVMKASCHTGAVHDVAFPLGCADLIVTASVGDIRTWNVKLNKEIVRIQIQNLECLCCFVTPTGSSIISGWNDGKIRSFYPESGRVGFVIPDAHTEKVTSIAICGSDRSYPWRMVSGGFDGRVRVWNVNSTSQTMLISLKEHRGPVNSLKVNSDSTQCISASADGSCIVWDLEKYVRLMAFFDTNIFSSVVYHPDESQYLTCGSNQKITYWDATDGQAIRVVDGAHSNITTLDIDPTGEFFLSGAADNLLKVWHYDDGLVAAVGLGHSGHITSVKLSPDQKFIVSVGSLGEIIFWEMPSMNALRNALNGGPPTKARK